LAGSLGSEYEVRPVWRQKDPVAERDAAAFWNKLGILPPGTRVEDRLKELCLVGYDSGELIGVMTAEIRHIKTLNCKMAMVRTAVLPDARGHHIGAALAIQSSPVLEKWSRENPAEEVMGAGAVLQIRIDPARHPERKTSPMGPFGSIFAGYTAEGHQFWIKWFDHATVPPPPEPEPTKAFRVTARQL
jgi:hypothetical protein